MIPILRHHAACRSIQANIGRIETRAPALCPATAPRRSSNTRSAGNTNMAPRSAPASPIDPTMEKSRSMRTDANTMATKPTTDVTHAATSAPPIVCIVSAAASTGVNPASRRS